MPYLENVGRRSASLEERRFGRGKKKTKKKIVRAIGQPVGDGGGEWRRRLGKLHRQSRGGALLPGQSRYGDAVVAARRSKKSRGDNTERMKPFLLRCIEVIRKRKVVQSTICDVARSGERVGRPRCWGSQEGRVYFFGELLFFEGQQPSDVVARCWRNAHRPGKSAKSDEVWEGWQRRVCTIV